MDLSEKMAFFDAFGALAGDGGVAMMDGMLNARGFVGFKETSDLRACAAHALGRIGTGAARRAMQRSAETTDIVVRSAVSRALRSR